MNTFLMVLNQPNHKCQTEIIKRILKNCDLWRDKIPRSSPQKALKDKKTSIRT